MATINLGRVKPVFRGAYNASTAYVIDDIVTYQNETYIAITATTGNLPTVTSNWTKLAFLIGRLHLYYKQYELKKLLSFQHLDYLNSKIYILH